MLPQERHSSCWALCSSVARLRQQYNGISTSLRLQSGAHRALSPMPVGRWPPAVRPQPGLRDERWELREGAKSTQCARGLRSMLNWECRFNRIPHKDPAGLPGPHGMEPEQSLDQRAFSDRVWRLQASLWLEFSLLYIAQALGTKEDAVTGLLRLKCLEPTVPHSLSAAATDAPSSWRVRSASQWPFRAA